MVVFRVPTKNCVYFCEGLFIGSVLRVFLLERSGFDRVKPIVHYRERETQESEIACVICTRG